MNRVIGLAWVSVAVLWGVALANFAVSRTAFVFEPAIYATFFVGILVHPAIRRVMARIHPVRTVACLAVLVLVTSGHLYNRSRRTYPFVAWVMYSRAEPQRIIFHQMVAIGPGGEEHVLEPWTKVHENYQRGILQRLSHYDRERPEWAAVIRDLALGELGDTPATHVEWRRWEIEDPRAIPIGSSRTLMSTNIVVLRPHDELPAAGEGATDAP